MCIGLILTVVSGVNCVNVGVEPDDSVLFVLPRSSPDTHAEALWKQEGTKSCQFPRNRAHGARGAGGSKWRECRRNTQTSAIVHGLFDTTHNLKVVGSNPTPATRFIRVIKRLCAALRGGVCVSSTRGSTVEARGREKARSGRFAAHRYQFGINHHSVYSSLCLVR